MDAENTAVEQSTNQSPDDASAERDAMIRAAEAASESEPANDNAKAKPANDNNGKTKPDNDNAEPPESPASKLAQIIKEREAKVRARSEVDAEKQAIAAAKAEIAAAKAEAERYLAEVKAERERLALLKQDPMRAIRELGWDHKSLVDAVVREDDPNWQALSKQERELEALKAELAETKRFRDQWESQQREERERRESQISQYQRETVVQTFLGQHATAEACPYLHALYEPAEIVAKGDRIADEYRARTGEVASLAEIAEYLEAEARERFGKVSQPAGKRAVQRAASGPRTLSAAAASERRATPKPVQAMSPEEERDALIAAYKDAVREAV